MEMQFHLAYRIHTPIADTDSMPPVERDTFYKLLIEQKEYEAEEIKKIQERNSNKSSVPMEGLGGMAS